jgi:hypothetical protein
MPEDVIRRMKYQGPGGQYGKSEKSEDDQAVADGPLSALAGR